MKWLLIGLVRGYRLLISPLLGQSCRYYPSCSSYALQALQTHGALRGSWLAARRLSRCHPWSPGGVDHVPPRRGSHQHTECSEHSPALLPASAGGPLSQGENH